MPAELVIGAMLLPWVETGTLEDLVKTMAYHELKYAEDGGNLKVRSGEHAPDAPPDSVITLDGEAG